MKELLYNKHILYFSPHYDDMIYSSSITIRELKNVKCDITNLNFFSKSGWCVGGTNLNIEDVSNMRLEEEIKMSKIMGFKSYSLGFDDSFVRGLDAFQELTQICKKEEINKMSKFLGTYLESFSYDWVFVPIAFEKHIDHRYVRSIAENVVIKDKIVYYEDLPYIDKKNKVVGFISDFYQPILFIGEFKKKFCDMQEYCSQYEEANMKKIKIYGDSIVNGYYTERIWMGK